MKVLLYCPLYPTVSGVHARTLDSIFALDFDGTLDIVFGHNDTKGVHPYLNLTNKHNHARKIALDGNYDAVLFVEADMIVSRSTLRQLISTEADIAYGLYVSRHKPHQWLAYSKINGRTGISFSDMPAFDPWGLATKSAGVGMGCTLIRRHVLKTIEFRCPIPHVADDWYLALDAANKGLCQKHHCGVVCGHIDGDTVYWPARGGGYSIQILKGQSNG